MNQPVAGEPPEPCVDCVARRVLVRPCPQHAPKPALFRQYSEGGWIRPAIIPSPADDAAPQHTLGTPADWVREGEERAIREWQDKETL